MTLRLCGFCGTPTARSWGLWDVMSCSPACDTGLDELLEAAPLAPIEGRRETTEAEVVEELRRMGESTDPPTGRQERVWSEVGRKR